MVLWRSLAFAGVYLFAGSYAESLEAMDAIAADLVGAGGRQPVKQNQSDAVCLLQHQKQVRKTKLYETEHETSSIMGVMPDVTGIGASAAAVYKTTNITFRDEAFKKKMYKEICPKAASYMVECWRREVAGARLQCEEYMKFEHQAQFDQYIKDEFFWISKALLKDFRNGNSVDPYLDMNEHEFLAKKKNAKKVDAACQAPFPFPKPDNNKICYRSVGWATYLRLGYWGKDNCVCGDQICEREKGAALAATQEPWKSWWESSCTVTPCPF